MTRFYGANRYQSYIVTNVTDSQDTIIVHDVARAPKCPFKLTVNSEIMDVIEVNSNILTVVRGREDTTSSAHAAGSIVQNRWTKGTLDSIWDNFNNISIDTAQIVDAAITSAKIQAAAITSAKIQDASITSIKIQDAAIDTAHIKVGAITTALIDQGAVGTLQIADGSITDAKIVGLTANKITAGTINAGIIEVVNLKAANITVGKINGLQIADDAIDADHLIDGSITEDKLSTGLSGMLSQLREDFVVITGDVVAAQTTADGKNTVFYLEEEPDIEDSREGDIWFNPDEGNLMYRFDGTEWIPMYLGEDAVEDLAITGAKISNATITDAKISYLDAAKITTGLLDAARIKAYSITSEKIATGSITSDKILAGSILTEHITAGAITSDQIVSNAITSDKIATGSIIANKIAANVIETGHISYEGLHADVITAGTLNASRLYIGPGVGFDEGYDPSTKETPDGAQQKAVDAASAAEQAAKDYTDANIDDVNISMDQPTDPVPDQLWLDTSTVPNVLKRWGWVEGEEPALSFAASTASLSLSPASLLTDPDSFTMQVNERVVAFRGDETAVVEDGQVVVGGRNIVRNGNFGQGKTGWISSFVYSTLTASDNILYIIGVGGRHMPYAAEANYSNRNAGDIAYFKFEFMVTNSDTVNVSLRVGGNSKITISGAAIEPDTWYTLSWRGVVTGNGRFEMINTYASAEEAKGKIMKCRNVVGVDLTSTFGPGNESSKEECDTLFANWTPAPEDITSLTRIDRTLPYFPADGILKTLRFYNRGLTDEELMQNYTAGQGDGYVKDGLVFDGDFVGEGDVLPDLSGEGNDAGIDGATWVGAPVVIWDWINASPTSPEEIGAETPGGSQEKVNDALNSIKEYLIHDEDTGLVLGATTSNSKVLIDHQALQILNSSESGEGDDFEPHPDAVAWIHSKKMFIGNVQATEALIVGVHKIERHENSDITIIRWIGSGGGS